ncbi:hypothetical protein OG875_05005 [Streptomyces sp. NBC_01498]|uniref:hypothetical protein n=1 Tax=Streptomyces sp. NBC_01498 TaxID=2975870 RepID=UPI002E7BA183|nr:hypothetical protein [Streptomyces sp. NBC_01498]WTL24016.1 hypothetical protein OG875_05005 [Streptomyces sp. NBC_01498]
MATKHSHGPNFGRRVDDCLRCQELAEGAAPVSWNRSRSQRDRDDDAQRAQEIRDHDCRKARCSVVCTFGDW